MRPGCHCRSILTVPPHLAITLLPRHQSVYLKRFSARQDRFAAGIVDADRRGKENDLGSKPSPAVDEVADFDVRAFRATEWESKWLTSGCAPRCLRNPSGTLLPRTAPAPSRQRSLVRIEVGSPGQPADRHPLATRDEAHRRWLRESGGPSCRHPTPPRPAIVQRGKQEHPPISPQKREIPFVSLLPTTYIAPDASAVVSIVVAVQLCEKALLPTHRGVQQTRHHQREQEKDEPAQHEKRAHKHEVEA